MRRTASLLTRVFASARFSFCVAFAAPLLANPFSATLSEDGVVLRVPAGNYVYADSVSLRQGETPITFSFDPAPQIYDDALMGNVAVLWQDTLLCHAEKSDGAPLRLSFQGCSVAGVCYLPQTVTLGEPSANEITPPPFAMRHAVGYLSADELLAFLDNAPAPASRFRLFIDNPAAFFNQYGLFWLVLLTLAGGFLLNLTPCVLPLIPVNLALIGVGAQNTTRGRGFLLGSAYAAGVASAYGSLGVFVLLTGAVFGTLQASPWFNLAIEIGRAHV